MAPFAKWANFDQCVLEQMKKHKGEKGFTMENAQAICGAIKKKVEG